MLRYKITQTLEYLLITLEISKILLKYLPNPTNTEAPISTELQKHRSRIIALPQLKHFRASVCTHRATVKYSEGAHKLFRAIKRS